MKMFKKFNKIFDKIASSGKRETHTIFKDWLNMTIDKWTLPNNKPLFTQNKRYTQQEYNYFAELYIVYIKSMQKQLLQHNYFDFLGEWWESEKDLTDKFKGQYFTPHHVVQLIAELTVDTTIKQPRIFYDCCCGSGRFALAHHSLRPLDYFVLEDLDDFACKMTIMNMLHHGLVGVVTHKNSLTNEEYESWRVNEFFNNTGVLSVRPVRSEREGLSFIQSDLSVIKKEEKCIKSGTLDDYIHREGK